MSNAKVRDTKLSFILSNPQVSSITSIKSLREDSTERVSPVIFYSKVIKTLYYLRVIAESNKVEIISLNEADTQAELILS